MPPSLPSALYDGLMADQPTRTMPQLRRGDAVPHFRVATLEGRIVEYSTIWQRRNLVLAALPQADTASPAYLSQLEAAKAAFAAGEAECVITRDAIAGVDAPAVVIADRWGEINHISTASDVADLPAVPEILDWLAHVQHRCPECEGEAR